MAFLNFLAYLTSMVSIILIVKLIVSFFTGDRDLFR